jgi:hypothetical protein
MDHLAEAYVQRQVVAMTSKRRAPPHRPPAA